MRLREAVAEILAERYPPGSFPTPGHLALAKLSALLEMLDAPIPDEAPEAGVKGQGGCMTDAFEYQNQLRRGPEFFGACSICGEPAGHKIEEELFYGPGHTVFDRVHPLTAELCTPCFKRVFMNYDGKRSPPGLEPAPAAAAGVAQQLDRALLELRTPNKDSPLKVAILGVVRQPGAPEPLTITTREEYLEQFPYASEDDLSELFDRPAVMVFEVQEAGIDPLPSPHPIARVEIEQTPAPLYFGDDYPRIARRRT